MIAITGGRGFIGRHIVSLLLYEGYKLRVLASAEQKEELPAEVETVVCEISSFESLIEAFKGCTAILHNAAYARDWGEYETFYSTNVVGTENVFRAAKQLGIKQVIMTGSISVYGEENSNLLKEETSPMNSHYNYFLDKLFPSKMNYYRDTKKIATERALQLAKEDEIDLTLLEPVWVFGEGEFHAGFYEYVKTISEGLFLAPGSKKNLFHVIYVKDLAKAYLLAIQKNLSGINRFIIGNDSAQPMSEIFELFLKEAKLSKPFYLPKWIAYPIGFLLELIYTLFRIKTAPPLTRARVAMFYDSIQYNTSKAKNILGFRATTPLPIAIKQTIEWYTNRGFPKQ